MAASRARLPGHGSRPIRLGLTLLPIRFAIAALLATLALPLSTLGSQASGNGLTLSVHLGYQDVVKPGDWMPVTVDVISADATVDGTLEIQEALNAQPGVTGFAVYQEPISIGAHAAKRIRTYVSIDTTGATVTARIVANGRVLVSQDSVASATTSTLVGVLSDDPTSLDDFAAVHPGGAAARVIHLQTDQIPESAIGLRAFDVLAIDDYATDGLTTGQRTAINDYVQSGGNLLLGTGATWRKTLAGLSLGILPMTPTATQIIPSAQALGGSDVEVATGDSSGGRAWLREGNQPLIVERAVGAGTVTLAAFDWNQDPVASWSGTKDLLRQVLARGLYGVRALSQNSLYGIGYGGPIFVGPGFGLGTGSSVASKSNAILSVLGTLPGLDLPSLQLTGLLVLVYVVVVGPVNYFVLGAIRRRALAWITVPTIALLAAGAAYGAGVFAKGRSVQANQVTILHLQPGWDRAYQETYTGIMAPTRGDYQASIAGGSTLISAISNNGGGLGSSTSIRVSLLDNGISLPAMTAFVLRGFATEAITSAPQLTANLQLVNGQLTGEIMNRSAIVFSDAVLIAGDSYQKIGALGPGKSANISLTPKASTAFGAPTYMNIYPNYFNGPQLGQPTDAQREADAKTQILALLPTGGSFKGVASPTTPLLVAWTHQSFQGLTVSGSHPRTTTYSAVALSLPVDQIGAGTLPVGVVNGRIVDLTGTTQQGPPGALLMQSGSVTYEFQPHLAAGLHLLSPAVSSQNPYGAKFVPVPPGTTGGASSTIQSQYWDWSNSSWTDIAYQDNGTTALPDSAVDPATGTVRLKVNTPNGGMLAGDVSLAGVVQ